MIDIKQQETWDKFWVRGGGHIFPNILAELVTFITKNDVKKVYDMGCGVGDWLLPVADLKNVEFIGFDVSELAVKTASANLDAFPNVKIFYLDMRRDSESLAPADLIYSMNVIRHIKPYKKVLRVFSELSPKLFLYDLFALDKEHEKKWNQTRHCHVRSLQNILKFLHLLYNEVSYTKDTQRKVKDKWQYVTIKCER